MEDRERVLLLAEVLADYRQVNKNLEMALTAKHKEVVDLVRANSELTSRIVAINEKLNQAAEAMSK